MMSSFYDSQQRERALPSAMARGEQSQFGSSKIARGVLFNNFTFHGNRKQMRCCSVYKMASSLCADEIKQQLCICLFSFKNIFNGASKLCFIKLKLDLLGLMKRRGSRATHGLIFRNGLMEIHEERETMGKRGRKKGKGQLACGQTSLNCILV
uniref:Uncharacterized protein n=1 Tax=Strigamia maritima TaxID=126957 RepID=T1IW59_STRMM